METIRENKTAELKEADIDALTIDEIKALLRSGDHKLIGEITGYTQSYVVKVFDKLRVCDLIIEASRMLLKNRQFVIEKAELLKMEYKLKRSKNGI